MNNMDKTANQLAKFTFLYVYANFAFFLFASFLSPYLRSLGYSEAATSLLIGVYPLTMILLAPVFGTLSDRWGRLPVIRLGAMAFILSLAFYLADGHWLFFALARILEAVAVSSILLVILARIEDSLESGQRGYLAGWNFSLSSFAKMVAPVLGGLAADYYFIRAPFVFALIMAGTFAIMLTIIQDGPKKPKQKHRRSIWNIMGEIKEFLSVPQLRGLALMGMVMHGAGMVRVIFLPLFIIEVLGLHYSQVGLALGVFSFVHMFEFVFGRLADRTGYGRMVFIACLVLGSTMLLYPLIGNYYWLLLLLAVYGLAGGAWNVAAWSLMSEVGEKLKEEGQVVTCYISLSKIGAVLASAGAGFLVAWTSITTMFFITGLIIIVGCLISRPFLFKKIT